MAIGLTAATLLPVWADPSAGPLLTPSSADTLTADDTPPPTPFEDMTQSASPTDSGPGTSATYSPTTTAADATDATGSSGATPSESTTEATVLVDPSQFSDLDAAAGLLVFFAAAAFVASLRHGRGA